MALEMVLSPLISVAVKKSADALVEQFCRMWRMDENRKTLRRHLLAVQEKIEDAQERAVGSPAMKEWMQELEAAAQEAVDVLDEFQYEALRSEAISQQPKASSKVIKGFFTHENPFIFRDKMSKKLTKVLCTIGKIISEMNTFNLTPRGPPTITIDRQTQSSVMESDIIGREHEKEEIIREVLNPQRERNIISVLAVIGMGGLGKTTLVQLVFNDKRVKEHFQLTLWVCVSTDFNVINIVKSIIQVASGNASTSDNKEVLQHELRKKLDKKRYLLVLDDVWNDDERDKWEELKMLLCSAAGAGSVIIVTTRNESVALIMEAFPKHNLAILTNEDSWKLFEKRAFSAWDGKQTEEHREIGKTIAHKCGGLPLVVNAMGGLMGTKKELSAWHEILKSRVWDELQSKNVLFILKLSYDHLPSDMKQCFAFCAIFPQDYEIEIEKLIQLWIANDFIPTDGSMENLEKKGRSIFNELLHRSFFQNVKKEETYGFSKITCQMHDLMHDLARKIVGNKCFTILKSNSSESVQEEVHHLSAQYIDEIRGFNNIFKQFPNIRTCLIDRTLYYEPRKKNSYLKSCSLRALKYQFRNNIPKEIGYMKHLRYLDLSASFFTILPETINKFYNLQTLILSKTEIQELPSKMRYMINLRHLFLDGCSKLQCMPIGLGQLKYLQTLTKYVLNSSKGGNIRELSQLNLLSGYISLSGLESIRDKEDAQIANLAKKTNLYSLELKWDETSNEGGTTNSKPILEALIPHDKLKYLHINGYSGSGFPKWLMEVPIIRNLKKLKLQQCINCAELPPVWLLSFLEDLHIEKMDNLISIVGSTGKHVEGNKSLIIFRVLKELTISDLPNLESWHEEDFGSVAFPELKTLSIIDCPKLKSIPTHVPSLEDCHIKKMNNLISIVGSTCKHVEESKSLITFRALKELTLSRLPNLESWHKEGSESVDFPELKSLIIKHCPKLKSVPTRVPLLASLKVSNCSEIKLRQISHLPILSKLSIALENMPNRELDAFRPPKTLEKLKMHGYENIYPLEEEEKQLISCQTNPVLRELEITRSNCFFSCGPGPSKEVALKFWKYFAAVEDLAITDCDNLVLWPKEELRNLECLKRLYIWNCSNLTGALIVQQQASPLGDSSSLTVTLPQSLPHLEYLDINNCPELVQIPVVCSESLKNLEIAKCPKLNIEEMLAHVITNPTELEELSIDGSIHWRVWPDNMEHLPSLEILNIENCPGIESFPPGLHLPSLERLNIENCPGIESFPPGLHLPSLERLNITNCPGIESFPLRLQQRLPSLQYLRIVHCPALERRCRSGGDYCHLISRIPDKRIGTYKSKGKSFLKNLPCIRGS
ncbi:NBS-LRR-like resistance protein [Rhynchospora pubera]|uniref:NBS-LRR-like resistance protein n=1 Tax=Rhynchospora pubera TaxID=906938 RepID=A0AAV8EJR2_9POAL|nr:NBS-LRR-like resistance protein [Rhynchospora pubera]